MKNIKSKAMIFLLFTFNIIFAEDDFNNFLKSFFADSIFQLNHINFPIQGEVFFISANDNSTVKIDTVFSKCKNGWNYIGYGYGKPYVHYTASNDIPDKIKNVNNVTYI